MKNSKLSILAVVAAVMSLIGISILVGPGCGSQQQKVENQTGNTADAQMKAPNVPGAPNKALFGQYYKDRNGKVWIYDGTMWVPHDNTVDTYYSQFAPQATTAVNKSMTQDEMRTAPCTTADGSGAHPKHAGFNCKVCHMVGGVMCFDPSGPAYNASYGAPAFDVATKTCTNVACHTVAPGTFSYYFPGDETDADGYPIPVLKTVNYGGGTTPQVTPSWYTAPGTAGCTACHANPPVYGSDGSNNWHSGFHANNQNVGAINPNACELCHNSTAVPYGTWVPVAFSSVGSDGKYHGYQINPAAISQHANGVATVNAKFVSQCFGCH
jgi:hypothetical protein